MRALLVPIASTLGGLAFQMSVDEGWFRNFGWALPWVWALCAALWCFWIVSHPRVTDGRLKGFHARIGRGIHVLRVALCALVFVFSGFLIRVATKALRPQSLGVAAASAAQPTSDQQSPNVNQNSQGATNSPNTNVNGNNDTVINNSSDPKVLARLDEIKKLLQTRGDDATPKELLKRYPLGYVVFDVDYTNSVFPYKSEALSDFDIDWSGVEIKNSPPGNVLIRVPNITGKGKWSGFREMTVGITTPKELGPFKRVGYLVVFNDIGLKGEILAISEKGIVVVLGFTHYPPQQ